MLSSHFYHGHVIACQNKLKNIHLVVGSYGIADLLGHTIGSKFQPSLQHGGSVVVLPPHSKKVLGVIPNSELGSFGVELARSPCVMQT